MEKWPAIYPGWEGWHIVEATYGVEAAWKLSQVVLDEDHFLGEILHGPWEAEDLADATRQIREALGDSSDEVSALVWKVLSKRT